MINHLPYGSDNIGKSETLSEFPEFDKSNSPLPLIGHKEYNRVDNMGTKKECYNKVCWRCGRVRRIINIHLNKEGWKCF